jgi:hypothetical protein
MIEAPSSGNRPLTASTQKGCLAELDTQKKINDFFTVDRRLMLELRTGIWPAFKKEIMEETDKFVVSINEDGDVIRQFKGVAFEASMPEYLHRLITSRADWDYDETQTPGS